MSELKSNTKLKHILDGILKYSVWGTLFISFLGLIAYIPGLSILGSVSDNFIPMAPATAISFILLAGSIIYIHILSPGNSNLRFIFGLSAFVILFGLLELIGFYTGRDLNLEDMLVPASGFLGEIPMGRMSPATGAFFVLVGSAVVLLIIDLILVSTWKYLRHLSGALGLITMGGSLVFSIAYLYGTPLMNTSGTTIPMALTTSLSFFLLSLGVICFAGENSYPSSLFVVESVSSGKPFSARQRIIFLLSLMITISFITLTIITTILYRNNMRQHESQLSESLHSYSTMIRTIADFNNQISNSLQADGKDFNPSRTTLNQLSMALSRYEKSGSTMEFTIAKQDPDGTIILLQHNNSLIEGVYAIPVESDYAEPQRLALQGKAGVVVALDYRGEQVLAAYEYISELKIGIVTKICLSEIRSPFSRAAVSGGLISLICILLGTLVFFRISNPVIINLENHTKALQDEIDHRRMTESELRISEEKFRVLYNNSPDMYVSVSPEDATILLCNETLIKNTGYDRSEIIGAPIYKMYHDDCMEEVEKAFQQFVKTGNVINEHLILKRKDGSKIEVSLNVNAIRDESGSILYSISSWRDITESKKTLEALKSSEDRFISLIHNIPGMVYSANSDLDIEVISGCEEICGISLEMFKTGKAKWIDFIHEDDKDNFFTDIKELFHAPLKRVHLYRIIDNDGNNVWVEDHKASLFTSDGNFERIDGIVVNINFRKLAEIALIESEKRFKAIFEKAPLGVALIDSINGQIFEVNSRFAEIAGRTRSEMSRIDWMSITHPDDIQRDLDSMEMLNAGSLPGFNMEKRYIKPDGSFVWINMTIAPLDRGDKSLNPRHLCMIEDISDRIAADEKRLDLEARLRQSQKLEAIGIMAGGIAHDFNNILQAQFLYTGILQRQLALDKKHSSIVKHITDAGERARDLIKRILTFSRQQETTMTSLNIRDILTESLKLVRSSMPSNISIESQIDDKIASVMGDHTQLTQVILNLCNNAQYAMLENGGILSVSLKQIKTSKMKDLGDIHFISKSLIELKISDTGAGMDVETQKRVFDPFFTTKSIGDGTGLGLAVVYGIIAEMNGHISVSSKPGEGSVFRILIPVFSKKQRTDLKSPKHGNLFWKRSVLLIDDEEEIIVAGKLVLESHGFKVFTSKNGKDALKLYDEHKSELNLVITDLMMPGMSGLEIADELLLRKVEIPIILMSGKIDESEFTKLSAHGISSILKKPWSEQELMDIIIRSGLQPTANMQYE